MDFFRGESGKVGGEAAGTGKWGTSDLFVIGNAHSPLTDLGDNEAHGKHDAVDARATPRVMPARVSRSHLPDVPYERQVAKLIYVCSVTAASKEKANVYCLMYTCAHIPQAYIESHRPSIAYSSQPSCLVTVPL